MPYLDHAEDVRVARKLVSAKPAIMVTGKYPFHEDEDLDGN